MKMIAKYTIWEFDKNESYPLIILDKEYSTLTELLNFDWHSPDTATLNRILKLMDKVESGELKEAEDGSERIGIEITKENSLLYDNLEGLIPDDELFPEINISNMELRDIIRKWKQERKKLRKRIEAH